jgi:hypothetical protein
MPSGIKQAFASRLTDVDSVAREQLGAIRFEGNKVYKYVEFKNATATVAAGAGSLVAYFAATGYANNRVVADNTDADAAVSCAGATLATITGTLGVSYYCWIQIKGHITLDTAVGSGAAGSPFYLTSTDKTAAIMSAVTQQKAGVSMNATTGVVLDCPF